jgi:acyl-CoA thioesterase-1
MNWVVFQIASGRAFFAAVALLVAAVLLRSNGSPRMRRVSTWSFLVGLIALSVSAAPMPYWAYALIVLAIAMGLFANRLGKYAVAASGAAAICLVAVALHEARYHVMPVLGQAPARQIAVIGDSITAGYGSNDSTQEWPAILRDQHGVVVQDLSRMGESAASAAKQVQQHPIDAPVVIIEIGGNDFLGRSSVREFEEGLNSLLKAVSKPGRQVAMFELPIPPLYEGFGRVQRDLASRYGVALIPKRILLSVVEAAEATVDSIHLTQQGHDRMAGFVWALLEPAVPKEPGHAEPGVGADSR